MFHVGQEVECIDDRSNWQPEEAIFVLQKYTITRILIDNDGDLILHLNEVTRVLPCLGNGVAMTVVMVLGVSAPYKRKRLISQSLLQC